MSHNLIQELEARHGAIKVSELTELLGVDDKHIYRMAARGQLPSFRVGGAVRFDPQEVANWLRLAAEVWPSAALCQKRTTRGAATDPWGIECRLDSPSAPNGEMLPSVRKPYWDLRTWMSALPCYRQLRFLNLVARCGQQDLRQRPEHQARCSTPVGAADVDRVT